LEGLPIHFTTITTLPEGCQYPLTPVKKGCQKSLTHLQERGWAYEHTRQQPFCNISEESKIKTLKTERQQTIY
jgi:hypothetical protein